MEAATCTILRRRRRGTRLWAISPGALAYLPCLANLNISPLPSTWRWRNRLAARFCTRTGLRAATFSLAARHFTRKRLSGRGGLTDQRGRAWRGRRGGDRRRCSLTGAFRAARGGRGGVRVRLLRLLRAMHGKNVPFRCVCRRLPYSLCSLPQACIWHPARTNGCSTTTSACMRRRSAWLEGLWRSPFTRGTVQVSCFRLPIRVVRGVCFFFILALRVAAFGYAVCVCLFVLAYGL